MSTKPAGLLMAGTLSIYLMASFSSAVCAETNEELLSLIKAGSKANASAIKSGKGKITTILSHDSGEGLVEATVVSEVVFSGDKFAVTYENTATKSNTERGARKVGSKRRSSLWYDDQRITVYNPDDTNADIGDSGSKWGRQQMAQYENKAFVTECGIQNLDDHPAEILQKLQVTGRETINGDDCIVAEFSEARADGFVTSKTWISPQKGYGLVRIQGWVDGGSLKSKFLVIEIKNDFRQYADGLWVPDKSTQKTYVPNLDGSPKPPKERVITYDPGFQFNVPIKPSAFKPVLPSGTSVTNKDTNARHRVP